MNIFLANKGLMLNVSLYELKSMSVEEMYIFLENLKDISKEMEQKTNGI